MLENAVAGVYDIIGSEGITRLTTAFYRRVHHDEVLRPLYPEEDLTGAEMRLRDFFVFRFGGPQHYITQRGHPRLRIRHAPFAIDQRARDRWVALMDEALDEVALPANATAVLREFLHDVATFLMNRPGMAS